MKLSRLYQPRQPAFWLMITLNLLSTALAWIARSYPLKPLPAMLVAGFAIINALIGLRLMWGLLNSGDPPADGKR
jgi:hypothetical protein